MNFDGFKLCIYSILVTSKQTISFNLELQPLLCGGAALHVASWQTAPQSSPEIT